MNIFFTTLLALFPPTGTWEYFPNEIIYIDHCAIVAGRKRGDQCRGSKQQKKTMKQKYDGKGNMWPCFFDMNTYFFFKLAQNLNAAVMAYNYRVKTILNSHYSMEDFRKYFRQIRLSRLLLWAEFWLEFLKNSAAIL